MVAVAVLAVLAALALPPWQALLRDLQARSLRAELVSSLVLARSTAVTQRRRVTVCALAEGAQCGDDWNRGWQVQIEPRTGHNGPATVVRVHARRHGRVRLRSSEHRPNVQFRADGRNAGTNQSIVLCVNDQEHSRVIVSVPGRVRSQTAPAASPC